jgi:chaperonin cofactor prefoldin
MELGIIEEIEKQSLEAHVELCAERYSKLEEQMETMEHRLQKVESIVSEIKSMLIEKETLAYKKIIGIGIGLIGSLLTALLGLILYVAKSHI